MNHSRQTDRFSSAIPGIVVAPVVGTSDFTRTGRVEIRLPGIDSLSAPIVGAGAGHDRGVFVAPKVGDNVVVAFLGGDVRQPFVLGGVWGGNDKAPIQSPRDGTSQYVIRTQQGQEIRIDEAADSITVRTQQGQLIECDKTGIRVSIGEGPDNTAVVVGADGNVQIRATKSITLDAPRVSINAKNALKLSSSGSASLSGDASCSIEGGTVKVGR